MYVYYKKIKVASLQLYIFWYLLIDGNKPGISVEFLIINNSLRPGFPVMTLSLRQVAVSTLQLSRAKATKKRA